MGFDITSYFQKLNVLDRGSVELVDGMVGEPRLKTVNAAKSSYAKTASEVGEKEERLLEFLTRHGHTSPMRHSYFTWHIKAPLFVFRQWWKYQIGSQWVNADDLGGTIEIPDSSWNETSGRYTELKPEFYLPTEFREQSASNRQSAAGPIEDQNTAREDYLQAHGTAWIMYQRLINLGVAREQARLVLPPSIYSECIWTCSLQTLTHFLAERLKFSAQFEIREYAKAVRIIAKDLLP